MSVFEIQMSERGMVVEVEAQSWTVVEVEGVNLMMVEVEAVGNIQAEVGAEAASRLMVVEVVYHS